MSVHLGDIPIGTVIPHFFGTYGNSDPASITMSGIAVTDIEIYKGTSMTQRASDNGYALLDTDGIDLDGTTGIHGFSIDTSDNSDSGFYAAGSIYHVVIASITVDSKTVNFVAYSFRAVPAESVAGKPKVDVDAFGGTAGTFSSGRPEVNATHFAGTAYGSADFSATMKASINTEADTALSDYGALRPTVAGRTFDVTAGGTGGIDWGNVENPSTTVNLGMTTIEGVALVDEVTQVNGFSTDAITSTALAASAVMEIQSGLATAAELATAQADLDILTGSDGVTLATSQPNYAPGTAAELAKVPKSDGSATWNSTALASINTQADTALTDYDPPTRAELTSDIASVLSKLLKYIQLLARKDAAIATDNATEVTEINANGGSGAGGYANTTDSQESIRDRGDAAWTSGGGGSSYLATGTVASTTGTTTTLDAGAVATTSYYVDAKLVITGGTGAGQERLITGYTSGRVATHLAWTTNPTGASTYEIRDARASVVVAGAGSGANSVNPTVDDGTDPLEGAKVRFTKGAESYIQTMEADGQPPSPFGLDNGTWDVVVTMPGYDAVVTTLVVDGTETPTYSLDLVSIPPASDPAQTTGYFTVRNSALVGQSGVTVYFRMTNDPGGTGDMFSREWFTATSGALGATTVTLVKGAEYEIKVAGERHCALITIPAGAGSTYELPDCVSDR